MPQGNGIATVSSVLNMNDISLGAWVSVRMCMSTKMTTNLCVTHDRCSCMTWRDVCDILQMNFKKPRGLMMESCWDVVIKVDDDFTNCLQDVVRTNLVISDSYFWMFSLQQFSHSGMLFGVVGNWNV